MSHSLARTGDLITALIRGSCLNVVTDRRRVLDACRVLPPTVILGVPVFLNGSSGPWNPASFPIWAWRSEDVCGSACRAVRHCGSEQ